jgi:two-component system, NarL family, nitrate/nitrite response regulator NarL
MYEGRTDVEKCKILGHENLGVVEAHRRNILRKLQLHSAAGLTRYALRHGLITL